MTQDKQSINKQDTRRNNTTKKTKIKGLERLDLTERKTKVGTTDG